PRCNVSVFSAWPGITQTGPRSVRPWKLTSTTSLAANPERSASDGLIRTALSQINLLMGLGHSCNQPLFAKRPSHKFGSGRKQSSRFSMCTTFLEAGANGSPASLAACGEGDVLITTGWAGVIFDSEARVPANPSFIRTVTAGAWVPVMNPSWSDFRQPSSKSGQGF